MSQVPSTSTPHPNFDSIFNSALDAYKQRVKHDLTSHPLLPRLQACNSPDAVLTVLREQIPMFGQSQSGDGIFEKWLVPTVNVLYAFSAAIGEGAGLVFSPARIIFAGVGVLLSTAINVHTSQDTLIEIFSRIESFFKRLEAYIEVPPTTAMMDIIIKIMVEVVSILGIATKEMKRGRTRKFLTKLIGRTDVEDSLQRLDKLTHEEAQMAAAELRTMMHKVDCRVVLVEESVQSVGRAVGGVDDKVEQVNRNHLRDNLRTWLSPSNPSTNHNIACDVHHEGSAQWFFRGSIYNQWKSTGSLLWVHGKPGSGKSILCSAVIQDIMTLRMAGRASVAYFYFDFRDIDKQRRRDLLPSLLMQLSAHSDTRCDTLTRLYATHDRGEHKPSDRAMTDCLKEMLAVQGQGPTYIIIDALDECPNISGIPSSREEVLELLRELVNLCLPNLHICVTSRPEIDIKGVLQPLCSHPVSLHDETGQKQDIINYVSHVVQSDDAMWRWRQEDKDRVIKTLSEKADGMFRWVFCQLEILRRSFPPSVRHILEELPESLDGTYERVLKEIGKPNQRHAHRMMQCLVVAIRPIRVEELAEVLAVDFDSGATAMLNPDWRWPDQERAVMSACSSLISIVNDGDSRVVQFSHFSVKEFLMSRRLAESSQDISRYHISLEPAHTILAQACLGVLLRLDDSIDRDSIESYPLALYAARYWVNHAQFEKVSSQIEDGMDCLFDADKSHLAIWLWIYNHDLPNRSLLSSRPDGESLAVPLYYAALLGFRDLAERLIIKYPEDVNAKGGLEVTPLHASAVGGHTRVFSLLIEHFPDICIRDAVGRTPLHRAARQGHLEIGQQLLSRGANVNALDVGGWTPLHLAAMYGQVEFARVLLGYKALTEVQTNNGMSPLHIASNWGRVEFVTFLLERGADPNARDKNGRTPSRVTSRQEIVRLLSEWRSLYYRIRIRCLLMQVVKKPENWNAHVANATAGVFFRIPVTVQALLGCSSTDLRQR